MGTRTVKCWAIKSNGVLMLNAIDIDKHNCIERACQTFNSTDWQFLKSKGFECIMVTVTITEGWEDGE